MYAVKVKENKKKLTNLQLENRYLTLYEWDGGSNGEIISRKFYFTEKKSFLNLYTCIKLAILDWHTLNK